MFRPIATRAGLFAVVLSLLAPHVARADVPVVAPVVLPNLHFLVQPLRYEVEPGLYVVRATGFDAYWAAGAYWVEFENNWFRAETHTSRWVYVKTTEVPDNVRKRWTYEVIALWPNKRGSNRHAQRKPMVVVERHEAGHHHGRHLPRHR